MFFVTSRSWFWLFLSSVPWLLVCLDENFLDCCVSSASQSRDFGECRVACANPLPGQRSLFEKTLIRGFSVWSHFSIVCSSRDQIDWWFCARFVLILWAIQRFPERFKIWESHLVQLMNAPLSERFLNLEWHLVHNSFFALLSRAIQFKRATSCQRLCQALLWAIQSEWATLCSLSNVLLLSTSTTEWVTVLPQSKRFFWAIKDFRVAPCAQLIFCAPPWAINALPISSRKGYSLIPFSSRGFRIRSFGSKIQLSGFKNSTIFEQCEFLYCTPK